MDREPAPADFDVWRAVRVLCAQYGDDARYVASRRADGLLERGDLEGFAIWQEILVTLRAWLAFGPPAIGDGSQGKYCRAAM
jgi:hypothetical protein